MRPILSPLNDIVQLRPTPGLATTSPKISSTFQRGFGLGLGFNSPKNDSQKVITLSTRVTTDIQRHIPRSERSGNTFSRKSFRGTPDPTSKGAQKSLLASKNNNSSSIDATANKSQERHATPSKKKDIRSYNLANSVRQQTVTYQVSASGNSQESLRKEFVYHSANRNLEIETTQEDEKDSLDVKVLSAKNAGTGPSLLEDSSKKLTKSQYQVEKALRLMTSSTPTDKPVADVRFLPTCQTEPDEEKTSFMTYSLKNKQNSSSSGRQPFLGYSIKGMEQNREREKSGERDSEKQKSATLGSRKIGFNGNGQLKYSNLTPGVIRANNFFMSPPSNQAPLRAGVKERAPQASQDHGTVSYESTMSNRRAGTSDRKAYNRTNVDLRSPWKNTENSESQDLRKSPSETKNTEYSEVNDQEKEESPVIQKLSLQNFVTKVNKGDFLNNNSKLLQGKQGSAGTRSSSEAKKLTPEKERQKRGNSDLQSRASKIQETYSSSSKIKKEQANQAPKHNKRKTPTPTKELKEVYEARLNENSRKQFIYFISNLEKYHREYDENNYFCQIYREHFIQTYQAMVFCKFMKPVDHKILSLKKLSLPKRETHKDLKTLIFDLDETLIHCNESPFVPSDVILPIKFPHGDIIEAGINIRPYALECLKELSQYFEIIVFTASHSCYANVVLDYLDPEGLYIHHRLFREHCMPTEEGVYIKDLRVIGNRNMDDMIIVDNAAYSFGYQIDNGIPIIPFYDNKADHELRHLIPYLKFLSSVRDVREVIRLTFKLAYYSEYNSLEEVLENLVFQE